MQIMFHLGVHLTDEDRLSRCLHKNAGRLADEGIDIPAPDTYRTLLRDATNATGETPPDPGSEPTLLGQIGARDDARRLVLSWQDFLSPRGWAIAHDALYPDAGAALHALRSLFPGHDVEAAMAIRNPATFMASLVEHANDKARSRILKTANPAELRWSNTISQMRAACPDVPLTIWCDEDTPYLWHDILRAVSGHSDALTLEHTYDWFSQVMTPDGLERMLAWLDTHPPQTEDQRRRVISAFLDKFYDAEKVDVNLDLPGWTEELVEVMTELYDQDVAEIRAIPDVTFLSP